MPLAGQPQRFRVDAVPLADGPQRVDGDTRGQFVDVRPVRAVGVDDPDPAAVDELTAGVSVDALRTNGER